MRQRPLYGGLWGLGRYAIATVPTVSNGLDAVKYMIIDPRRGKVLSISDNKVQALAAARRLLLALPVPPAANDEVWEQAALWSDLPVDRSPSVRHVSRRRREVFERSQGRCHYCGAALTLDGRWHVEHQVPRALGGDDAADNLVAACAPCNLAKSDRTALEFVTRET